LEPDTQQAKDIERFRWFSNGYLALDPLRKNRIIDIRYSMVPNQLAPLWSIELSPEASDTAHVAYRTHREGSADRTSLLLGMLLGGG
jgi:inner membrane protein